MALGGAVIPVAASTPGWRDLRRPLEAALGVAGLTGVVAAVDPFRHHLSPPCPLHAVTGLWCPFCGATRAVWAGAHGDFRLMLHSNALLPLIACLALWGWLAWLGRATGWWSLPDLRGRPFQVVAMAVLVAFTVLRNLPGLGALAPPSMA